MNNKFGRPQSTRGRATRSGSTSGKDAGETRREGRFDKPRPTSSRSTSGKGYGETRREGSFDKPRPTGSRSTSGKGYGETRREDRFDKPSREDRFDKPHSPRSQSGGKGFAAYKKTDRTGSDSRFDKPGFKKTFTKNTSESSESRGFRGKPRDADWDFSRGKRYEPREQKESRRGLDDKRGFAKERTGEKRYQSPTKRGYDSDRPFESRERKTMSNREKFSSDRPSSWQERKSDRYSSPKRSEKPFDDSIRLNKFIANSGVCSRREADTLIAAGAITVNGEIVSELGAKVKTTDKILYGKQKLVNEKKVYILLNKPKDYITTSDDPMERKTVIDLIKDACRERVFPVGRLDRNTTGILLLTNDGDLAKKLTHPKHGVVKLYQVSLDKALSANDMEELAKGVKIDGVLVVPDEISYVDKSENRKEIGVAIHSGQNRVVRRMFEHFGYSVEKLDRVVFAGLTKKDLPRGRWRFLSSREVGFLKMIK